jgi:hypothetical protein
MSGAYVFIHEGDFDYAFRWEKGLPLEELGQTSKRAPLIHLDDFRLAEIVAVRLQQEAGLSQDDCETFREFKAIRQANLSKEDIALAMDIDSQNRPEWLKPWVHRARQIVEQIRPFLQDDKAAHQANDRPPAAEGGRESPGIDATDAEPEWSVPMSKTELTKRLVRRDGVRPRKVEGFLKKEYGLEHIKGYQWRVRLDKMDPATRKRFE